MKLIELLNYPNTINYITLEKILAINLPDEYHVTDYEYSLNKLILFRNDKRSLVDGDRLQLIELSSIRNKNIELYFYNKDRGDRIPIKINGVHSITKFFTNINANTCAYKINLR